MPRDSGLIGVAALLAAITMLFAAFSSAYIVRRGLTNDWTPLTLPRLIWIAPVALLFARSRAALPLGIIAMTVVIESCRESSARGPAAAFFFVFSGAFLLCMFGGVAATALGAGSRGVRVYWLYLAGLWCWLLLLMEIWR